MELPYKIQHNILNILKDVATRHYTPEQGLELVCEELHSTVDSTLVGESGFWHPNRAAGLETKR